MPIGAILGRINLIVAQEGNNTIAENTAQAASLETKMFEFERHEDGESKPIIFIRKPLPASVPW